MTKTNTCDFCIDGRRVSEKSKKERGHENQDITLCENAHRDSSIDIIWRFCGLKAYVTTKHYPCFRTGTCD